MHIYTHMHVSTHTYIHIHTHTRTTYKCAQMQARPNDCALPRHRAAQTTSDHLYWCETNPPDPWPLALVCVPTRNRLQRCSAPKIDDAEGDQRPARGKIVPETPFCPTPLLARRDPSPALCRVPSPGAFSNICGFQQPSRAPPAAPNSMAHPISAASSSRRAPFRPRASPARATGHAPK